MFCRIKGVFAKDAEVGISCIHVFKHHKSIEHVCTDRKTNGKPLEVYFDYRRQLLVVGFCSDYVQVCDLGSNKS